LLVLACRQRRAAEIGQNAVGQRQQIDLLRCRQRNVGPAAVSIAGCRAGVDAHFVDRHVDVVEATGRRIGHCDVKRTCRRACSVSTTTAATSGQHHWHSQQTGQCLQNRPHGETTPPCFLVVEEYEKGDGKL